MREYFLTTERLAFSRWQRGDGKLARLLWGDPQVTRLICATGVFSPREIEARLEAEIDRDARFRVQYWPVFCRRTGDLAGCCGLRPYGSEEGVFELGVHLRPPYWRQGLASEGCRAVIGHAFGALGASFLVAGHNPANEASRALLARLGFVRTHDEFYPPTGLMHPTYRLLPEERRHA